ncbi:MAG: universal stress protein [Dehalococcoidia bacterium]|nr:universal stress protein [Dehalococcoidia bacterium]
MYKKIMVPLDGSQIAECVIPHIETIAKKSAAKVELVTVIEPLEIPTRGQIAISDDEIKQIDAEGKKEANKYLDQVSDRLTKAGIKAETVILSGRAADRLTRYAINNEVDLIIMATHGRSGISKLFWGSVAEKILRATDIPVLLIKTTTSEMDS